MIRRGLCRAAGARGLFALLPSAYALGYLSGRTYGARSFFGYGIPAVLIPVDRPRALRGPRDASAKDQRRSWRRPRDARTKFPQRRTGTPRLAAFARLGPAGASER